MGDAFERLISQRVSAYASTADDSDWLDVQWRAQRLRPNRRRLRTVAIGATLLLAIGLFAAPGWGLGSSVVDLFTGEPAPPDIQEIASGTGVRGAPDGVVGEKTTKVMSIALSNGQPATLWVAPSNSGEVCLLLLRSAPLGRAKCGPSAAPTGGIEWDIRSRGEFDDDTVLMLGRVPDKAERLVLAYGDGTTTDLALTKGFFLSEIPFAHHAPGARPSALTAYDSSDGEIARTELPLQDQVFGVYNSADRP